MSLYEIQVRASDDWKIVDAYEDLDDAYDCARRIERMQLPEELRVRRVDEIRPGISRARTMYSGGWKAQREKKVRKDRDDLETFAERNALRRDLERLAAEAEQAMKARRRLRMQSSPLYLTVMSACLVFSGLTALYLVEKTFLP